MSQIGDWGVNRPWTEGKHTPFNARKVRNLMWDSIDRSTYRDETQIFFDAPLASFNEHMETYAAQYAYTGHDRPSHVIAFDAVLNMGEKESSKGGPTIKDSLRDMGYKEVWHGRTMIDSIHPDPHSRGGLRVWSTARSVEPIVTIPP